MRCKIKVKPISINNATSADKAKFKKIIKKKSPKRFTVPNGKLALTIKSYYSNPAQDRDSNFKYTQDAICETYGLQDANIYDGGVKKRVTRKGKEKIIYRLESYSAYMFKHYYLPILSYALNGLLIISIIYLISLR